MSRILRNLLSGAVGTLLIGCVHNVAPKITPTKIPTVHPAIHARATLLIAPGFESYTTERSQGIHTYNYHMGASAAKALTDLASGSFEKLDVHRVGDAEVLQWLAAAGDTSTGDVLLVPSFASGGTSQGFFSATADVQLRLDVRVYRTGTTFSWIVNGHTTRAISSPSGLAGSALERALGALTDTLSANRAQIEHTTSP